MSCFFCLCFFDLKQLLGAVRNDTDDESCEKEPKQCLGP